MQEIALGTANFGQTYGVANEIGQLSEVAIAKIIETARVHGIRTIDTAYSYGESLAILGRVGVGDFEIISKVGSIPSESEDVARIVTDQVLLTLEHLRNTKIKAMLVHNVDEILGPHGEQIFCGLVEAKRRGLVEKIGVSIYDPISLDLICRRFPIDLVQAPMNVFDNRIFDSGWLDRLSNAGIEVHSRSVFLQGLLLRKDAQLRAEFSNWREDFEQLGSWFSASTKTPLAKCVSHIKSFSQVSRLVVGVDTESQLMDVIEAYSDDPERAPKFKLRDPDILLDPSKWMQL